MRKMISPKRVSFLYVSAVIFWSLLGCFKNYERATTFPENSCLIYIEDVVGKDGLGAGNFGEIVAFDLKTQERFILTKDAFYDMSPTVLKNRRNIIYESKRLLKTFNRGLGSPSKLCVLDVVSGQVEMLPLEKKAIVGEEDLAIEAPVLAHKSNRIAFCAGGLLRKGWRIYIYNLDTDTLQMLINIPARPLNIVWSSDDTRIAFDRGAPETKIFIVDVEGERIDTLSSRGYQFSLGDIRNDSLLYVKRAVPPVGELGNCAIEILSLKSMEKKTLYIDTSNLWVESPKFGEEAIIYFIKEPEHRGDYSSTDIYSFNWQTKYLSRITSDGREKRTLRFVNNL